VLVIYNAPTNQKLSARIDLISSECAEPASMTYLFQCCFVRYSEANIIGKISVTFSLIKLSIYSLFQKYSARSATCAPPQSITVKHLTVIGWNRYLVSVTKYMKNFCSIVAFQHTWQQHEHRLNEMFRRETWKCGLATHFASCLNSGFITFWNSVGSMTSRISSSSFRYITYQPASH